MNIPYTYLLLFKPTNQLYYGVRYSKNCHPNDFWNTYFTSSKIIHFLIKIYGKESFSFQIRKIFKSKQSAINWESKILKKMNVRYNQRFLNIDDKQQSLKAIQNKFETQFIYNEITFKMIRIIKGHPIPEGWVLGNISARNNTNTKNRIWCHDPITLKAKMIKFIEELPEGWILSRPSTHSNSKTLKNKKLKWYTNGIESILINEQEEIPFGFYPGRTKSIEEYISIKKANNKRFKGSTYYNDGIKNYVISQGEKIPEGLKKGKLKK